MARQLTCHLPSLRAIQPFFTAVRGCSVAGRAGTMPNSWLPLTLRISLRSQSVHFGPAARPSPMQAPMRAASRAESRVLAQSMYALESVRPQICTRRVMLADLPSRPQKYEAALLSLLRIMLVSSLRFDLLGLEVRRR